MLTTFVIIGIFWGFLFGIKTPETYVEIWESDIKGYNLGLVGNKANDYELRIHKMAQTVARVDP